MAATVILSVLVALPAASGGGAAGAVIFTEDFEHEWPGTLPNGWERWDDNEDSGIDYWCRSLYERVSPTHSAWCAQIGDNSLFGNANNKNVTRLAAANVTSPRDYILRYDTNMDGYMRRPLTGIDSFATATVTFSYWAMTGNSTTALGTDYMWVGVSYSSESMPLSTDQVEVWRQPYDNSSGWKTVSVNISTSATWLLFNFHSGPEVQEGGPFIGVFIDDIVVTGFDGEPPVSVAAAAVNATNAESFDVMVETLLHTASVEYLELYYRFNGTGSFVLYTTPSNPTGRWNGPSIVFTAKEAGRYEIFSIATDRWGHTEEMKVQAEVVVTVEREPPSSAASVSGRWGSGSWYVSAAEVSITAWDPIGISSIKYRVDNGPWATYQGTITVAGDGEHTLQYYAVDRASNAEGVHVLTLRVDQGGPAISFYGEDGQRFDDSYPALWFDVSDDASGVGLVEASIDGGDYRAVSHHAYMVSLAGLSNGSHSVTVRAWDSAGNMATATMKVNLGGSAVIGGIADVLVPLVVIALTVTAVTLLFVLSRPRG